MDKALGTKSAAEDYLEFKMDEGNDYNILEDSDIDDIQSDPIFQQIASNIICSDLKEYGFQVCQQGLAAAPNINQSAFSQYPNSIFEDQNGDDEDNNNDNDDDNDNGDNSCGTNLECQLSGDREWAKDHIGNFDELGNEDQESMISEVLNDVDEDYLDEQEAKENALGQENQEATPQDQPEESDNSGEGEKQEPD